MTSKPNGNGDKLQRLLEKQKQVDAQLAAEKLKLAKRRQCEAEKLFRIIGEALVRDAARFPDFKAKLMEGLDLIVRDEKQRGFLKTMGWLP